MARAKSLTRERPDERLHNTRPSTNYATIASKQRRGARTGSSLSSPIGQSGLVNTEESWAKGMAQKKLEGKKKASHEHMNDSNKAKRHRIEGDPSCYEDDREGRIFRRSDGSSRSRGNVSKKRKATAPKQQDEPTLDQVTQEKRHDERHQEEEEEERLRRYRPYPPASFLAVQERALSQRMFVIERARCGTADCPEERFEIAGTTGNVYSVHIARQPSCNCPHALKGNQCKHVVYILERVLKAPNRLIYQLALLPSELRIIFASVKANPLSSSSSVSSFTKQEQTPSKSPATNQKPIEPESDCPICAMPLLTNHSDNSANVKTRDQEEIVFCRSSCGNNIHKVCFDTWAAVKAGGGSGKNRNKEIKVPCPFCRAPWELDLDHCDKVSLERARKVAATGRQMTLVGGAADAEYNNSNNSNNSNNDNDNDGEVVVVSEDGYVNVARELGIDGRRDYSMYHQPWVRSVARRGRFP